MKTYTNPTLYIAYFYNNEDEKDAVCFVCDNTPTMNINKEFLKYANKYCFWNIKEENIEGIYKINDEEDKHGRKYQITTSNQL